MTHHKPPTQTNFKRISIMAYNPTGRPCGAPPVKTDALLETTQKLIATKGNTDHLRHGVPFYKLTTEQGMSVGFGFRLSKQLMTDGSKFRKAIEAQGWRVEMRTVGLYGKQEKPVLVAKRGV
jgi:hypothetical protein